MKSILFILFTSLLTFTSSIYAPNTTDYDYQFFPINDTRIPVCIDQEIMKKNFDTIIFERNMLGNETCLPSDSNCRPAVQDCCGFYDCVERNCGCGANGYPLGYGKKYCQIFSNYPFEGRGSQWRDATLRCLQRSLIPFSQCPPTTCLQLKQEAFDSHAFCYTNNGVCLLSPKDLLGILAITYGDILTLDGIKQILETAKRCGFKYIIELELEIISQACKLNDVIRKLLPNLWRSSASLPKSLLTTSLWDYDGSKLDGTDSWKLKIYMFHEDDSLSMGEQAKQLKVASTSFLNTINSAKYVDELNGTIPDTITSIQGSVIYESINTELDINSGNKNSYPYILAAILVILSFF